VQGAGSSSIVERMLGFVRLNERVIKDVERDTNATSQALIVVVLAAIASAIGAIVTTTQQEQSVLGSILGGAISAVAGWIVFSVIAYFVGASLFSTSQTSVTIGQVLRVVGFAQTPKLLSVLGFIPVLGGIASLVGWIWFVVVAIVAIRTAFEFTTERAIGTAIMALIVQAVVVVLIWIVISIVIGIPLAILDWIF
jgi:hypothetical protein